MKLRQLIKENDRDTTQMVEQYFHGDFYAVQKFEGLEINGNIKANDYGLQLTKLPWKIHNVHHMIINSGNIQTLKNFPNFATSIDVSDTKLKTFKSDGPIISSELFQANALPIETIDESNIETQLMNLNSCHFLKSFTNNKGHIKILSIKNCKSFIQDPKTIENVDEIYINLLNNHKMPIINSILFAEATSPLITFSRMSPDQTLYDICIKYRNAGMRQLVNLMRELRDAGYKNQARIY